MDLAETSSATVEGRAGRSPSLPVAEAGGDRLTIRGEGDGDHARALAIRWSQSRLAWNLLILPGLFSVYVLAGKVGLSLAFVHASASAVWPPTGIALAAFLILGYRPWPVIFAGAFVVNITTAGSVATSLGIATGNTLEALLGAYLVNRFANGVRTFDRAQDVFKFAGLAATLSTSVSATAGVVSLSLGGYATWADFGRIWLTWWLGDAVGALIFVPLLLLWFRQSPSCSTPRRPIEAAGLLLLMALATAWYAWPQLLYSLYPLLEIWRSFAR